MAKRRSVAVALAFVTTVVAVPTAPATAHAIVPIKGSIIPGADGRCSEPIFEGSLLRWRCDGATETFTGSLMSTADAVFSVRGSFNTRSGTTRTAGSETFTGCLAEACGTLAWRWQVTFTTDPATATVLAGKGHARIAGGTGGLDGATGSFTIACLPPQACGYVGHVGL